MNNPTALAPARWRRLIPVALVTFSFAYDGSSFLGAAGGSCRPRLAAGLRKLKGEIEETEPAEAFQHGRNLTSAAC